MRLFGDLEVTRTDFERAVEPEMLEMVAAVQATLSRAQLDASEVQTVLLTGGSSLVPVVQDRLRSMFPRIASDELAFDAEACPAILRASGDR